MRYFLTGFALLVVLVVSVAGFRGDISRKPPIEVFPDMDRQYKLRPQEPNSFFPNGKSSQLPVDGTVSRAQPIVAAGGETVYVFDEHPVTTGMIAGTTNWVALNPMPINSVFVKRGQERYNISCTPCHGYSGDGKGTVSKFGIVAANLHERRLVDMTDGEIYNTITHGKNTMGPYGANIKIQDRWAIVAYMRALQTSRMATIDDVPESERSNIK